MSKKAKQIIEISPYLRKYHFVSKTGKDYYRYSMKRTGITEAEKRLYGEWENIRTYVAEHIMSLENIQKDLLEEISNYEIEVESLKKKLAERKLANNILVKELNYCQERKRELEKQLEKFSDVAAYIKDLKEKHQEELQRLENSYKELYEIYAYGQKNHHPDLTEVYESIDAKK